MAIKRSSAPGLLDKWFVDEEILGTFPQPSRGSLWRRPHLNYQQSERLRPRLPTTPFSWWTGFSVMTLRRCSIWIQAGNVWIYKPGIVYDSTLSSIHPGHFWKTKCESWRKINYCFEFFFFSPHVQNFFFSSMEKAKLCVLVSEWGANWPVAAWFEAGGTTNTNTNNNK